MSEYIVHVAIMQDCFNIMLKSDLFCDEFKKIIVDHRDFGESASTTMSGDSYTWKIMDDLRSRWDSRSESDNLEAKLAFVLGWVSHRAADRQMKPVFRIFKEEPNFAINGNECTLYDEAKIYTEYYMNREKDPYKNTMELLLNDSNSYPLDIDNMKGAFNGMLKMAFMRMHTMKPSLTYEVSEIEGWIDNLHTLLQKFKINMEHEAEIIANPDPEKYKKYIVDTNFFNDSDPLIVVAKKLRFGIEPNEGEIDFAIKSTPDSDYATALHTALKYTIACHDFLYDKSIPVKALCEKLDINKVGRDGIWV